MHRTRSLVFCGRGHCINSEGGMLHFLQTRSRVTTIGPTATVGLFWRGIDDLPEVLVESVSLTKI